IMDQMNHCIRHPRQCDRYELRHGNPGEFLPPGISETVRRFKLSFIEGQIRRTQYLRHECPIIENQAGDCGNNWLHISDRGSECLKHHRDTKVEYKKLQQYRCTAGE